MSHEINALWAAHIVHHQSEDYNLSVALRQSWFQNAFSWVFYLPLALVGFDPIMFLTLSSFNTLYQFWIHTRVINKMGPFEWIFNTPSHHRVHHGSDPMYIDKNHGGTLIIWDRMFGTFCEEKKEPHYGITTPLNSWNPVWANFHYWVDLFQISAKSNGIKNKILVFLKPPGWFPEEAGGIQTPKEIDDAKYSKFDKHASKKLSYYVFGQFVTTLLFSILILFKQQSLSLVEMVILAACIIVSLTFCGALFENKNWAIKYEYYRIVAAILPVFLFLESPHFLIILIVTILYLFLSSVLFYFSTSDKNLNLIQS